MLARLAPANFVRPGWFPIALRTGGILIVAAIEPDATAVRDVASRTFPEYTLRFVPAGALDLRRLAADFAPSVTGAPVGVVRTNLAYWRNTMAAICLRSVTFSTVAAVPVSATTALTNFSNSWHLAQPVPSIWIIMKLMRGICLQDKRIAA